jgi:FAD:protein FMN transferase
MEVTFTAMNSTIKLKGVNQALQKYLMNYFTTFESKASRFIQGNELDFINRSPLHLPLFLEETIADLFEKSMKLSRKVDYYVNPFLGDVMKSIGYTASYSTDYSPDFKISVSRDFVKEPFEPLSKQWIIKNENFSLDFGGFGKGYIVDRAKEHLLKEGVTDAIVNAGGDLAVIGTQQVGIEHPVITGKDMMRFYMTDVSMATSGKNYRKWTDGYQTFHHIVNGQSGEVATNNVLQATAIAQTTMEAETISKLFCILPFEQAKKMIFKKFPYTAYVVYFNNHKITVGGDNTLFERLEVSS